MRNTSVFLTSFVSDTVLTQSSLNFDKESPKSWKVPTRCGEKLPGSAADSAFIINRLKCWFLSTSLEPVK